MKRRFTIILTMLVVALFSTATAFAQENGDYRSTEEGNWSDNTIWEVYNGTSWEAAATAPDGSENITVSTDTVFVDADINITGYVSVTDSGVVSVNDGSALVFEASSTYEHARDAGSIPEAEWWGGSTVLLTGIVSDEPDDIDQAFSNFIWNNPNQDGNINIGWDDYTLGGDLTVLNTNGNQFRMTSADDEPRVITINGSVIVDGENAEFTTTGSGSLADYNVTILGDVQVLNGASLAPSRGSSGRAVWTIYGDFIVDGGILDDSDDHDQTESFVFAADTSADGVPGQEITITNISYDGPVHFRVADSSGVLITSGSEFIVEDSFVNEGVIEVAEDAILTFDGSEAIYEHARNGGEVPTAVWTEGSTLLLTGTTDEAPDNLAQDIYNLRINTPNNDGNKSLGMDGNTIYGNVDIVTTGGSRWYFTSPNEAGRVITVMGDITLQNGEFSTNGSGTSGNITIHHYGDIVMQDGNLSISRGSGPHVEWYMYEGNVTMNAGKTQNSAAREGSAFIFSGDTSVVHQIDISPDVDLANFPFIVDSSATVDIGLTSFDDMSDNIEVRAGASIATADTAGFETNLDIDSEASLSLSSEAIYIYNGTEEQQTGYKLPFTVYGLTIDNVAGVVQSRDITVTGFLLLANGVFDNTIGITLGDDAEIITENGSLLVDMDTSAEPGTELPNKFALNQNYPNPFNPVTTISYDVPEMTNVILKVYDITGREVATLINKQQAPGSYNIEWDAQNLATGMYLYRLTAGNFTAVRKLTLIK